MVSNIGVKSIVVFFAVILLSQGIPLTYAGYVTTTPDGTSITNNDDGSITYHYSDGRIVTEYPPPNEASKITQIPQNRGPPETTTEFRNGTKLITKAASDPTIWVYPDGTRIELDTLWYTPGFPKIKQITHPNGTEVHFRDGVEQYRFTTTTYPDGTTFTLYGDGTKATTLPNGVTISERSSGTVIYSYPNGTTFSHYEDGRILKSDLDGKITELTSPNYTEQTSMHDPGITILESASKSAIPKWVKTNAEWWAQGLISDKEFAAGLGFLVKSKIIQVDDVEVDSEGSIDISDDIVIPKWIKTNAEWWSSGVISDSDFKSGIQFMIKEKVIDFTAKKAPLQNRLSSNISSQIPLTLNPDLTKSIFQTHKWNEAAMTSLLKLKDFERNDLKDASQKAWNDYGDDKNSETLTKASSLEESSKRVEIETKQILKSLNKVKEFSKQALNDAKKSGNPVLDLEDSVSDATIIIDDDTKIQNQNDYDEVEKNLKKSHNEASDYLQKSIQGVLVKNLSPSNTVSIFSDSFLDITNDMDYSKLNDNTVSIFLDSFLDITNDMDYSKLNDNTLQQTTYQISDGPSLATSANYLSYILGNEKYNQEDNDYNPRLSLTYGYTDSQDKDPYAVVELIAKKYTTSKPSVLDFLHERIMIGGRGASESDPPIKPFLDIPVNDYSNSPIDDTLSDFFNIASGDEDDSFRLAVEEIIEDIIEDIDDYDYDDYDYDGDTPVVLSPPPLILSPSRIAEQPDNSVLDFLHERIVVGGRGASSDDPPITPIPILIDISALHLEDLEQLKQYFDIWISTHTFKSNIKNMHDIEKNIPPKITSSTSLQNTESNNFIVKFSSVYNVVDFHEDLWESHNLIFEGSPDLFLDDPVFRTEIAPDIVDIYSLPNNDPIIYINLDGSTSKIQTTFVIPYDKYKEESNELFQVGIEIRMIEDIPQEAESLFDEDLLDSYDLYQEIRDGKYHPQVEGAYSYIAPEDSPSDVSPPPGAGSMQQLFPVDTLEIGGLHYPDVQFRVEQAEHCNLNLHYHSHGGPVYSLEGGSYSDPDPNNCGFGLQGGSLGFTTYFASSDQITTWESTTGYDIPGVP